MSWLRALASFLVAELMQPERPIRKHEPLRKPSGKNRSTIKAARKQSRKGKRK